MCIFYYLYLPISTSIELYRRLASYISCMSYGTYIVQYKGMMFRDASGHGNCAPSREPQVCRFCSLSCWRTVSRNPQLTCSAPPALVREPPPGPPVSSATTAPALLTGLPTSWATPEAVACTWPQSDRMASMVRHHAPSNTENDPRRG